MGKPYKQPQRREVMAGSKLEIEMLQYSLNEANQKLDKKTVELEHVTRIMEQTTKVADQRKEKVDNLIKLTTTLTTTLTKRITYWKVAAIIEAGIIIGQILLKVVA